MTRERLVYDTDTDPGVQVVMTSDTSLSFSCQDDWCGDTESGFGATVNVELDIEQVRELWSALGYWLVNMDVKRQSPSVEGL